jgi:hypothetical protein
MIGHYTTGVFGSEEGDSNSRLYGFADRSDGHSSILAYNNARIYRTFSGHFYTLYDSSQTLAETPYLFQINRLCNSFHVQCEINEGILSPLHTLENSQHPAQSHIQSGLHIFMVAHAAI